MKPEGWQQIEKLYHAVLKREMEERAAFLDQACAGDEELRREVESLLAYRTRAENFIESPALEVAANMLAADQGPPRVGRKIGPYQIISLLGTGGMGEVYLAEDSRLGRKVALKLLPKQYTQDLPRVRRFEREARAASALNHPNILTIHEIGQLEDTHYIATEFIDGETLRRQMARGRVPLREALDVACQVAGALAAAHEAGIVHRDIKPENIMVRPDGLVKVLDLGLAKLTEAQAPSANTEAPTVAEVKTETGVVMGTVSYMSPEQARGLKLDARTDLFSLGVVMYEMVAGRAPFAGETTADVIASLLEREPPPLSLLTPEVPQAFEWIIAKVLRKDREERYQTAKEMFSDLKSLKHRLEFEEELERSGSGKQQRGQTANKPSGASEPGRAKRQSHRRQSRKAITSLAILPLANTSNDPNMEYLSDGITESIINTLSQLPKLRVVARSTVFRYKGQEVDPQEVGHVLDVQAILTGRVRQVGDNLIIGAELIDIESDSQLWGESYNRRLSDIFEVQEEIAKEIAEKLRLRLSRKEKGQITKRYTENTEAYQLYLKGRYHWHKFTDEGLQKARECFRQAIEIDPDYALAFAGLADTHSTLGELEAVALPPREAMHKAKAAAMKALEVDDALAEAHASLAKVRMYYDWDWPGAGREFERALKLNPNYANAYHWYSHYLMVKGRVEESLAMSRRALELDPLDLEMNVHLAWHYYYAREYDQALAECRKTIDLEPDFSQARYFLGWAYERQGKYQEAIAEFRKAITPSGHRTAIRASLAHTYALAGQKDEARTILSELLELLKQRYVSPYDIAIIHTGLGEKDRAFEWLERAYEDRYGWLVYLGIEPRFDRLRSDPRFADLLRRIGLAPSEAQQKPISLDRQSKVMVDQPISQAAPRCIAVLPFKPISADLRDEYLELGMADALITRLSDISQIVVRPTSTVRKYTDLDQDCVTAGRELRVESVLEGSILKLGDRIRVTARLVRVEDGRSLWTGKFDESFTDIFEVEDLISERVATALALKLTGEERERLTKRYTENTEAYHLYLKGRYHWNKRSKDALHKAVECFDQAIEIDPNYALAYAGLADCYTKLGDVGVTAMIPREAFARARRAALRAIEIDSSLAEVYASLGHLDMHLLQWADAERDLKRAIELNPNYATAHHWYACFMAFHQRFDEALERIDVARKLDPLSLPIIDSAGEFLYFARRNDEAIEQFRKALEMDPNFLASRINLGRAYEQAAMFSEAEDQFVEARQIADESIDALAALGHTYAMSGNTDAALEVLARLTEMSKERYVSPYDIALIHAALAETDEAFRWLGKAYDECVEWMVFTNVDPRLDPLRTDARFSDLLGRLGFAP